MPLTLRAGPEAPAVPTSRRGSGRRARAALALAGPLARAIEWAPLAAASVFTLGLVWLVEAGQVLHPSVALDLMRIGGTLLGGTAAFALVDAMAADVDAAALPRWVRQGLRCLLAGGAAVVVWCAAFASLVARMRPGQLFPVGDLLVEAVVCLAIGLAAGATAVRFTTGRQAALAAVVVQLALVLGTMLLPEGLQLWPPTCGYGAWDEAHRFWLLTLPVPVAWLVASGRDVR